MSKKEKMTTKRLEISRVIFEQYSTAKRQTVLRSELIERFPEHENEQLSVLRERFDNEELKTVTVKSVIRELGPVSIPERLFVTISSIMSDENYPLSTSESVEAFVTGVREVVKRKSAEVKP